MLTILIDNLLDNAIKYGGQGGHVAIRVLREGGALHLVVEDDGDGVANTALDRLRDRFFRVEGQPSPGSGLGLSIVEKIARAHDGCVELGSGMAGRGLGVRVRFGG